MIFYIAGTGKVLTSRGEKLYGSGEHFYFQNISCKVDTDRVLACDVKLSCVLVGKVFFRMTYCSPDTGKVLTFHVQFLCEFAGHF